MNGIKKPGRGMLSERDAAVVLGDAVRNIAQPSRRAFLQRSLTLGRPGDAERLLAIR